MTGIFEVKVLNIMGTPSSECEQSERQFRYPHCNTPRSSKSLQTIMIIEQHQPISQSPLFAQQIAVEKQI